MLKKKELENFFIEVPPHHNMDTLFVFNCFDLLRVQPRTVGYLAERLDRDWANTKKFLTESRYSKFILINEFTKEYSLNEDLIRQKLIGYDPEGGERRLSVVRDENSPGHLFDPVLDSWFSEDGVYPEPPGRSLGIYYTTEYQGRVYSPFMTMCYIFSCSHGSYRDKITRKLGEGINKGNPLSKPKGVIEFDIVTRNWSRTNIRDGNYTFFERNFRYLPELWTRDTKEDYGLSASVEFIQTWLNMEFSRV